MCNAFEICCQHNFVPQREEKKEFSKTKGNFITSFSIEDLNVPFTKVYRHTAITKFC